MVPPGPITVASSDVLSELFETLPIGVVAMTADTRVLVFNQYEEKLAARKRERVLGRRFFDEIAPCMNVRELAGRFNEHVRSATLDETIEFSFPFPHVNQPRDVVVRMRSFIVGGVPHGMLLIEDVSIRRSLERMRETLASLLVHDMKSPLTAIIANLELSHDELVAAGNAPPLATESIADGLTSAQRLNRMILDLLDVTRLETGSFPLDRVPTDVAGLVEGAAVEVGARARGRGVAIVVEVAEGITATLDGKSVRRVLDNLLDNAVRHSPRDGRVVVEARIEGGSLELDVADEGPGIPAELQERVFEKFGQVVTQESRPSNHGLGLTFARMATRAHGGNVTIVADGRPRGTTFRVTLPLVPPAAAT